LFASDRFTIAADILYGDINSLPLLSIAPYRENEKLEIPSWNARFGEIAGAAISMVKSATATKTFGKVIFMKSVINHVIFSL
jgi:hypothetical protein